MATSSLPRLSAVIISYNQAQFLGETVASVVRQRGELHELFALDGGSTDGSADLLAQHAGSFTYWHSRRDRGQSDAIRQGFARATGDILYWINSDDVLLPGAFAKVRQAFAAEPALDVVTGYSVIIDEASRIVTAHRTPGESLGWTRWGVTHVCQPSCFFRRDLYERVGGVDEALHCTMDTDLFMRMHAAGSRWGQVRDFVCAFRRHGGAKGRTWLARYAEEGRLLATRHPECLSHGPKQRLGRWAFRAQQAANGRYLGDYVRSRLWRGRTLAEIFGT